MMRFKNLVMILGVLSLFSAACATVTASDKLAMDQRPLTSPSDKPAESDHDGAKPVAQKTDPVQGSSILPVGDSPVRGEASAKVTIVEFGDFQCPFCARAYHTLRTLQQKYPNDIKFVFKHYPLDFHRQALLAAKAAVAAQNQGKFWEMHDFLFDHQREFHAHANDFDDWIIGQAQTLNIEPVQFEEDYRSAATADLITRDMKLATKVAVRGTPHFFVNGERFVGAKPLPAFDEVVKEQIAAANDALKQADVTQANLYARMVAKNYDGAKQDAHAKPRPTPAHAVEFIPVDSNDPSFGNTKDPLVTIVEFSDFQCPFCNRALPTVEKIKKTYGGKVRFIFMNMPLQMHRQAQLAAQAAMAAHRQGKFWQMHDKLFAEQREFRAHASDFKEYSAGLAKEIGLNVRQFKKDFDSQQVKDAIEKSQKIAQQVGVRGTPNFWINGINLRGAQPFEKFQSLIDAQITQAEALKTQEKLSGDALYKAMVAKNKANAPTPNAQNRPEKPADKVDVSKLAIGDAPVRGPKNAPVTIVAFADFQCPFCKRGGDSVHEAIKGFKGKVKLVYKHFPLPFHKDAKPAARAALAAKKQGKFWQMHDLLYEHQRDLGQDGIYDKLAKQLGLNLKKFNKDMANPDYDKLIQRDIQQGQAVGVRGTPAFFINGTRVVGAQPTAQFQAAIEQALKEAKQ